MAGAAEPGDTEAGDVDAGVGGADPGEGSALREHAAVTMIAAIKTERSHDVRGMSDLPDALQRVNPSGNCISPVPEDYTPAS